MGGASVPRAAMRGAETPRPQAGALSSFPSSAWEPRSWGSCPVRLKWGLRDGQEAGCYGVTGCWAGQSAGVSVGTTAGARSSISVSQVISVALNASATAT